MKFYRYIFPQKTQYILQSIKPFLYDLKRFAKYSSTYYKYDQPEKLRSYLTLKYHVIEKGLTMPETRLGFGSKVLIEMIDLCQIYSNSNYNLDHYVYKHAIEVLLNYVSFHAIKNFEIDPILETRINELALNSNISVTSKQLKYKQSEYFKHNSSGFDKFCTTRYSVRNFIQKEIPLSILKDSIALATKSPSDCNRQPVRVHIVTNNDKKRALLDIQNGNRGFGHLVDTFLVITSDVSVFHSINERNAPAFNAGLFSMSLLYALHFNKIGTCMLNWSASVKNDIILRRILDIPQNEQIFVILACGYLPDEFCIAASPRSGVNEITTVLS